MPNEVTKLKSWPNWSGVGQSLLVSPGHCRDVVLSCPWCSVFWHYAAASQDLSSASKPRSSLALPWGEGGVMCSVQRLRKGRPLDNNAQVCEFGEINTQKSKTVAFHLYVEYLERGSIISSPTLTPPMKNCLERCFQGCRTIKHCLMHKTPLLWDLPLKMLLFHNIVKEQTVLEKIPPLRSSLHLCSRSWYPQRACHGLALHPVITTRPLERTLPQRKSLFVQRTSVCLAKKPPPHGSSMPWNNKHRVP